MAVLFLSAFYSLGLLLSTRIRRSSTVLILLLVIWVLTVIIIPQSAVYVARQIVTVPDKAAVDKQAQALIDEWTVEMFNYSADHPNPQSQLMRSLEEEFGRNESRILITVEQNRSVYTGRWPYAWSYYYGPKEMVEWYTEGSIYGHNLRMDYEDRIWNLYRDYQGKLESQVKIARFISFLSPSWVFSHGASYFTRTSEARYRTFLDDAASYRQELITYMRNKGGLDSNLLFTQKDIDYFPTAREILQTLKSQGEAAAIAHSKYEIQPLYLEDLPRFNISTADIGRSIAQALPEILIIVFLNLIFFTLAWVSFLRADVR
ncbi:hypothetical protein ES708_31277 [subsurface metagenome]